MKQTVKTDGKATKMKKQTSFAIFLNRFRQQKAAMVCLFIVLAMIIACYMAPVIAPYPYDEINAKAMHQGPSWEHPFGTDDMGRDIFSRILYGGRYSIAIGLLATAIGVAFGMFFGAIAGFFGGTVDMVLMRVFDVLQALPNILLSIIISTVLGPGFGNLLIAMAAGCAVGYARLLRANMLTVRKNDYVEAATAIGCSNVRIIVRHVIPNALTPLIVQATMGIAQQILGAATLAYIGLGIQPPSPEWGAMLNAARDYVRTYPYMLVFPGLAIAITVLCFNMIGDGVRDALDPKLKN